jgi:Uma2 family endonuclease
MRTVQLKHWSCEEYDKMIDAAIFAPGERVELIDGDIVEMSLQDRAQATAVCLAEEAVRAAFGAGVTVRTQMPLALDPYSEPEPDVAVIPGSPRDYREAHPTTALLVVEVADRTQPYDRVQKGSLYARAGVADDGLLNLSERRLEVYREPVPMPPARYGWGYQRLQRLSDTDEISPLAAPQARLAVADLLP